MTTQSHMRRLMDLVDRARERAREAKQLQAGAEVQLETVEYELAAITRELAAAGIIPAPPAAAVAPIAEAATVPVEPPQSADPPVRRRAAG